MRRISSVQQGSPANRYRIKPGDVLLSVNGEPVLDEIDYQALTAQRHIKLVISSENGETREIEMAKPLDKPLGLQFDDSLIGNPRTCGNQCVFCFVDQMPKGMRASLYVKDDDWRLSLLMGNYITLTNVGDREFERIIKRKASPLYISVHATDAELRVKILGNKHGSQLMDRLRRLKDEGLTFHCQLVLCPGLNDGDALVQSLEDLLLLAPQALSVAVVPVGLTRHREGLPPIRPYTKEEALAVLSICEEFQKRAFKQIQTRFAFPADEFLCIAGSEIPDDESYEHYAQIENGIGMLRQFEEELKTACLLDQQETTRVRKKAVNVLLPCGTALAPYLTKWAKKYFPSYINAEVIPIRNDFFGETVTVSGLIVGQDLINQLSGRVSDAVLVCETLLNSDNKVFLDEKRPQDIQDALGIPVLVFRNHGGAFYQMLTQELPAGNGTERELK
jgi:putative radical SAM enzyme (TIGR03279 family)